MHILQVLSASALIAAGVALTPKYDAPPKYDTERKSAGSLVVGVALVTVAVELIFIILRFLNVGLLNYKIKWFLIVVSFHEGGGGGGGLSHRRFHKCHMHTSGILSCIIIIVNFSKLISLGRVY